MFLQGYVMSIQRNPVCTVGLHGATPPELLEKLLLELLENHKIMEFKSPQEVSSSAFCSKQGQIQAQLRLLRALLLAFGG